ncbi:MULTISPECIES: competence type IV pilus major pilin ComGC [Enterococcaceae]|uniref:competence type IV pilus major pilin ComGC n=2 Tax=Lactobacillales TaxID=186826 RepID=UPI001F1CEC0A|nr:MULTISPECIES: competence type IV pilus major pilin ComGC [Enterococcaceae]MCI0130890.1 prepilin-type N-terminal cleavage/methylation domain-containing protein [Vagococcus sp. CY53-2]UNM89269.1 prepilin-type N-terminal cleavage/methylation domain-containing protein [Vagococcus sp. CY52-2]
MKLLQKLKKKNDGFTLLEMLIVLLVIAVLIILFVPNLSKQQASINKQGDDALSKVIQTQTEMYYLDNNERPKDLNELVQGGYISKDQKDKAEKIGIKVE